MIFTLNRIGGVSREYAERRKTFGDIFEFCEENIPKVYRVCKTRSFFQKNSTGVASEYYGACPVVRRATCFIEKPVAARRDGV